MRQPLRVLILEDSPDDAELMVYELRQAGFDPVWSRVVTENEYLRALHSPDGRQWEVILADFSLPQFDALLALEHLRRLQIETPLIVVTGTIGEEVAVECIRQGAADYLIKDRLTRLGPSVVRALDERRLRIEKHDAESSLRSYAERLRTIHEIDRAILSTQSLSGIVRSALQRLRQAANAEYCGLVVLNHEDASASLMWLESSDSEAKLLQADVPSSQIQAILRLPPRGRVHYWGSSPPPDILLPSFAAPGSVESLLVVSLEADDDLIGVLELSSSSDTVLDGSQSEVAREVSDQLAVAIRNAQLFDSVQRGHERLAALSRHLVQAQEAESRRIASELHDEVGQLLTGLKLTLEMAGKPADAVANRAIGEARGIVDEILSRVRALSLDLRPAMLDDLGLLPALLWYADRYTARTGVKVSIGHSGAERRFPQDVETAAYRIVQEALTNVARHAEVHSAMIRLWADDTTLVVQIVDEGRGFDSEATRSTALSSGLNGMTERATLLGGRAEIRSSPGNGTRVTAELPVTVDTTNARWRTT